MVDVVIRQRTADDDVDIVTIANAIYPEFPPLTVEDHRFHLGRLLERQSVEWWVAERRGGVVGMGELYDEGAEPRGACNAYDARRPAQVQDATRSERTPQCQ